MSSHADVMGCQLLAARFLRDLRRTSNRFLIFDRHSYLLTDNHAEYQLWATADERMTFIRIDITDPNFHDFITYLATLGLGEARRYRGVTFYFAK